MRDTVISGADVGLRRHLRIEAGQQPLLASPPAVLVMEPWLANWRNVFRIRA
jgi:hypothetical protein